MTDIVLARYSAIDVWETMVNNVQVMRRVKDDCMNATQILKVAGHSKAKRTSILAELDKWEHEKIQGGYGRYQGTWISLVDAKKLAKSQNVDGILDHILNFDKSVVAYKHASTLKKHSKSYIPTPIATPQDSPKMSARDALSANETLQLLHSRAPSHLITTPPHRVIDNRGNTVMHWACALGHIEYLASLSKIPLKLVNSRQESPLAFACTRQENYTLTTFSKLSPLYHVSSVDSNGRTFLHTIVAQSARSDRGVACTYYMDCVAKWFDTVRDRGNMHEIQVVDSLLDATDNSGNTALHIAILLSLHGMVKVLLSLKCRIDIVNGAGDTALGLLNKGKEWERILEVLMQNSEVFGVNERDNLGERVSGLIESATRGALEEITYQTNEIDECSRGIDEAQCQVRDAIEREMREAELLKQENLFYARMNDIVSKLEGALEQVKKASNVGVEACSKKRKLDKLENVVDTHFAEAEPHAREL